MILLNSLAGCHNEKKKLIEPDTTNTNDQEWSQIRIQGDYQKIVIFSWSDSIHDLKWEWKDTVASGEQYTIATNYESQYITVDSLYKDSIYQIVKKIITDPVYPEIETSCYMGNLMLCITKKRTRSCFEYFSSGTMKEISPLTKELYELLNRKMHIINN